MPPAAGQNYFELFGLPVAFDVDTEDLAVRYRALQRRVHPDRFANASAHERRLSLQMTALINEAFQTLKDPARRGGYLLSLRGVDLGAESDTAMDPDFLMEQMAWREQLDALRYAENPHKALAELANRIELRLQEKISAFRCAFADNTPAADRRARAAVREMQFLQKLRREIDNLEEELI
jgi:molecular chaperone HscB